MKFATRSILPCEDVARSASEWCSLDHRSKSMEPSTGISKVLAGLGLIAALLIQPSASQVALPHRG